MIRTALLFLFLWMVVPGDAFSGNIPPPELYGQVVLMRKSRNSGMAAVVFDHWLHRAKYTCRLCHVDIGFAMEEGGSGIDAATNMQGYYCGTCHDGKRLSSEGDVIFAACAENPSEEEKRRCDRCHSRRKEGVKKYDFETFAAKFPRQPPGYVIDWEAAEDQGLIQPVDALEGVSIRRGSITPQADFSIASKADWMQDVLFSHKKHAQWTGCELCHPEIFASTERGTARYTMFHIASGQYCGACHTQVAFSYFLCHKCHTRPMR